MHTRREFGKWALTGLSLAALPSSDLWGSRIDSTYKGVKLGIITGSLNPLPNTPGKDPIDTIIQECVELQVGYVEFVNTLLEPPLQGVRGGGQVPAQITPEYTASREALRQWRLTTTLDKFRDVRKKFDDAGITLFSYVMTFSDDFTDPEIDAVFKQAQALKVKIFCTNQTRVSMGPRLAPYAEKYKIHPAFHNHANTADPNEVASVDSIEKLLAMSKQFMVNLDIGHFTAGNNDAVAFLEEHHDRITHIHFKDRKRDNGPNVAWGEGDTPIKKVLKIVQTNHYPIYCIVEREFRGTESPVVETKKCLDYMKASLA